MQRSVSAQQIITTKEHSAFTSVPKILPILTSQQTIIAQTTSTTQNKITQSNIGITKPLSARKYVHKQQVRIINKSLHTQTQKNQNPSAFQNEILRKPMLTTRQFDFLISQTTQQYNIVDHNKALIKTH